MGAVTHRGTWEAGKTRRTTQKKHPSRKRPGRKPKLRIKDHMRFGTVGEGEGMN